MRNHTGNIAVPDSTAVALKSADSLAIVRVPDTGLVVLRDRKKQVAMGIELDFSERSGVSSQ